MSIAKELRQARESCRARVPRAASGQLVNDVHSQLNETRVSAVVAPASIAALRAEVRRARETGRAVSVAGGRHAMGGQQFATGGLLLDMRRMNRVLSFDAARYEIEVEAGIRWPELIAFMQGAQRGRAPQVAIVQKQTGADDLSIGGALAANIHGRGLRLKPFVQDVESFVLVDSEGCARTRAAGRRTESCSV